MPVMPAGPDARGVPLTGSGVTDLAGAPAGVVGGDDVGTGGGPR